MKLFHSHRTTKAEAHNACPLCGSPGIVQCVDICKGVDVIQCNPCQHRWEIERSLTERLATAG